MVTLVIGGAASGKSEFAEELVMAAGDQPRYYIATMQPFDQECRARICRHREMRAKKRFETVECFLNLEQVTLPRRGVVLLECMSNLVANELYSSDGAGDQCEESVQRGIRHLRGQCKELVIVSNVQRGQQLRGGYQTVSSSPGSSESTVGTGGGPGV